MERLHRRTAAIVLVLLVAVVGRAQAQVVRLVNPIRFYGAYLSGFQEAPVLKLATGTVVRPSQPDYMFVTIKLELSRPFEYVRGCFREIELVDEAGRSYRYRGWLTDQGWMQIDDDDTLADSVMGLIQAGEYPAHVDIHFEVPASVETLVLKYQKATATLFSLPH